MTKAPWRAGPQGLEVRLRVTPKSRSDEIAGLHTASDGTVSLMVKVRALPDKGEANAAVIDTLARGLGIPKSRVSLIAGATARNKTVLVQGDARGLENLIAGILNRLKWEKD